MRPSANTVAGFLLAASGQVTGSGVLQERQARNSVSLLSAVDQLIQTYVPSSVLARVTSIVATAAPAGTVAPDVLLVSALAADTPPPWLSSAFIGTDAFWQSVIESNVALFRPVAATGAPPASPPPAAPPAPAAPAPSPALPESGDEAPSPGVTPTPTLQETSEAVAAPPTTATPPPRITGSASDAVNETSANATSTSSSTGGGATATVVADLVGIFAIAGLAAVAL